MRCMLALAFLFCSLQDAAALQIANEQDYRDIDDQISKAVAADNKIVKDELELPIASKKRARELANEIANLRKESKDAHEQALWLTLRAYDIIPFADNEPILDNGVSVLRSPEKGKRIAWLPIFDDIGRKPVQDEFGRPAGDRDVLPEVAGNTASDGISRIFPGAFTSPAELASILIHEQLHVRQNTTPGEGDDKMTAELEVEAYEKEQRMLIEDDLGYSKDVKVRQKKRLREALDGKDGKPGKRALAKTERAAADKTRGGRPLPERSLVSHSEDEINSLIKQAKEQIQIAQRDHDERLRNTLLKLTYQSCANPGSVTQAELDGLPKPHRKDFLDLGPYPLAGC